MDYDFLHQAVFPVFIRKEENGDHKLLFTGTGFFIEINSQLIFITASHVGIQFGREKRDQLIVVEYVGNKKGAERILKGISFINSKYDISAYVIDSKDLEKFKEKPRGFKVLLSELRPLEQVFTFGFPFTQMEENVARIRPIYQIGYINRIIFQEEIIKLVNKCFEKNYQLDFPSFPGISGAPLLVRRGIDMFVGGMIYGKLQTSYLTGPIEMEEEHLLEKNLVTRHEVRNQYEFGLACDYTSIFSLASEALSKLKNKTSGKLTQDK
ncbi:MAG: hypothetical protein GF404_09745 [candidate division Zixibacteria bacterium]|nr:hypothetical protein [candidate division Zixibacteria bacterium]